MYYSVKVLKCQVVYLSFPSDICAGITALCPLPDENPPAPYNPGPLYIPADTAANLPSLNLSSAQAAGSRKNLYCIMKEFPLCCIWPERKNRPHKAAQLPMFSDFSSVRSQTSHEDHNSTAQAKENTALGEPYKSNDCSRRCTNIVPLALGSAFL